MKALERRQCRANRDRRQVIFILRFGSLPNMFRLFPLVASPLAMLGVMVFASILTCQRSSAIDFVHDIVPILNRNCVHCHGGRESEGDFSMNTRAVVADSGYFDEDDPLSSYLLELITSSDPDVQMPPPDRPRVSEQEVVLIRRWLEEGMPWDADFTFALNAYEPPLRPRNPDLPPVQDGRDHSVDRILDQYLSDRNLDRPRAIDDATFLRRVSLDLIGLLPTPEQLDAFIDDKDPAKRAKMVDALLGDDIGYADHWLTFFNDLLRNDYSGTGFITGGRQQISGWLYQSLRTNKRFDVIARELIAPPTKASQGYIDGIEWRGEVSAGQTLPIQFSQSISQSFLGINMKCASCHDSFIDRWTLKDAYGLAAIYANNTLELHRCDKPIGETAKASWLFPELGQVDGNAPREERLEQLASLMTHPENGRFARTIVNRLWNQLMGRGIVHPLDAMQSEPWNEDLLDHLAHVLVDSGYDLKAVLRRIATSQAYQSQSEVTSERRVGDDYVYRGPRSKRMTAEQFIDNIWQVTGAAPSRYDAPVVRSRISETVDDPSQAIPQPELTAKWIWGPTVDGVAPGQESIVMHHEFNVPAEVVLGGVVVTCDNAFDLYVNKKWVGGGDDWSKPQQIALNHHLKKGSNSIHAIVKNESTQPNAAGFFLQGHFEVKGGSTFAIESDGSWQYNPRAPKMGVNHLGKIDGQWNDVTVVATLPAWSKQVDVKAKRMLAEWMIGMDGVPMVRASLLKNTPLMKSLGRPMREQIVSMRPDRMTTLEAIDLANEPSLADAFAMGALALIDQNEGDIDRIVLALFRSTLTRNPTEDERDLLTTVLGDRPDQAAVQDAMWAVCMLPEYFLIR